MTTPRPPIPAPVSHPRPAPSALLGTPGWEVFRSLDLRRRAPDCAFPALPSPSPCPLSPRAGRWAAAVVLALQTLVEEELSRDPAGFELLERSGALVERVRRALPELCLEAGMLELPYPDLAALCTHPDADEALATVASVVLRLRSPGPPPERAPVRGIGHR